MTTYTGSTFEGANGKFTAVRYKRNGEWFPGVWNRKTDKREFFAGCSTSGGAADTAARKAESAAGEGAKMALQA